MFKREENSITLLQASNFEMTKIFYKMDKQFVAVLDEAVGIRCFKRLSGNFMTTFVRGTNFILKFFFETCAVFIRMCHHICFTTQYGLHTLNL